MTATATEPITQHWTTCESAAASNPPAVASAADVNACLALIDVADIDAMLATYLAAATDEVALMVCVPWRFSADDPPVAMVRMIAHVARRQPHAGGPHTARLLDQLRCD